MGDFYLLPRLDFSGFLVCVKGHGRGAFGNMLTCSVLTASKMNHTLRAILYDKQPNIPPLSIKSTVYRTRQKW